MKAENRWASVTFDVLTCPALAAIQLCLRLLGQSWRVVSEWQRPGHGAWGRWQRGPWAFWGLVGRFCACLQGTHPLVLLVSIGAGHGPLGSGYGSVEMGPQHYMSRGLWACPLGLEWAASWLAPRGAHCLQLSDASAQHWATCLWWLPAGLTALFLRGSAFKSSVQFLYFFQQ